MKAAAITRYRCVCEECDPLPPIEGLHPLTYDGAPEERTTRALFGVIARQVMPIRRKASAGNNPAGTE
ncbi:MULTISPECIES: hypothetical protein [Rhizobium]|uniref:hypothetical protein n=1 Tax=Rhizobium TaxID=379 RepID=UPI000BE986B1|nr:MULTISPECIES: hypothetical protein [Rhizobium]PDV90355.1 hypothetical protein CO652_02955 [Rhizobium sp. H4]WET72229.1 hypothetical protein PYR68_12000 [Rhizobium croatiense]